MFVNKKEYLREIDSLANLFYSLADRLTMLEERTALLERTVEKLIADKKPKPQAKRVPPSGKPVASKTRTQRAYGQ